MMAFDSVPDSAPPGFDHAGNSTQPSPAARKSRVLILGYSITAIGYAFTTRDLAMLCPEEGIEVEVCGVGGINLLPMAVLYESVARRLGPFDHVVLEVSTTAFGSRISDWSRDGLDLFYDLFDRIAASGAKPALVNLYRDDFDYDYRVYDMVLEALSARHGIPLLDLGAGLLRREGREFCRGLLRDGVHTTDDGSVFQALEVWDFIRSVVRSGREQRDLPSPQWHARAIDIATACGLRTFRHRFSGLELECGVLLAGDSCRVDIPPGIQLYGISFLSGPVSAPLELHLHGAGKQVTVEAYDELCYFRRFNFTRLALITGCTAVTIAQSAKLPSISLKKRTANLSTRVGYVVALHYFEKAG